jgi:hypothetical protein
VKIKMLDKSSSNYITNFKEAMLILNQARESNDREPLEDEISCSLFTEGLKVPEFSSVKSKWTLKKEEDIITFEDLV